VRIEDDILVTTNEPVNLSGKPEKSEEIEALMKEKSVLDGFA
jgi:Xaa-Pro aminopeptidase